MPYKNSMDQLTPQDLTPLSKPVRILHIVGGMDRGGAETWLMHILRNIDRQQFQMDFLVHVDQHYAYDDEIKSLGSKIIFCAGRHEPLLYASSFKKVMREQEPYDIVHVHLHHFSGYPLYLAKQAGIPVRIIHSHIDTSSIESTAPWPRKIYTAFTKWLINQCATFGLAASQMAADDLFGLNWENNPRRQLIYYGIDLVPFHQPVEKADLLAEFNIPANALVIGHIGRFESQKNHHFLIEIAAEIAKREPNMRLLLLGIGTLRDEIEEKVAQLGLTNQVIFAGSRPDIPRLMKGLMDIFLFPSCYEGLGIVLVEAQAAGLPCVFSDVIPVEADLVKPLVTRVSLTKSAADWSEVVLANRQHRPATNEQACETISHSAFNIQVSVEELTKFYTRSIQFLRSTPN